MITILMMSAKLATLGFLETNFLKQRFLKVLNMPVKVFTSLQVSQVTSLF